MPDLLLLPEIALEEGSESASSSDLISPEGHIAFPSIEQFRNTVKKVRDRAAHNGMPLPVLRFTGTVKMHGTNAGVVYHPRRPFLVQSRTNIIKPGKTDNAGFAAYVEDNRSLFENLGKHVRDLHYRYHEPVVIYGEWCGGSIQKGVALNGLPKMFVAFGIRIYIPGSHSIWLSPSEVINVFAGSGIKSVFDFKRFYMTIDFNRPEIAQDELGKITTEVEAQCPIGASFGSIGTGEGVVWRADPNRNFDVRGLTFKVKGEKHSESKVKVLAPINVEKIASMRELVATILTTHRLEKKLEDLLEQGFTLDMKHTGQFLKIVGLDVHKEEGDTITASGLDYKTIMSMVTNEARQFWMNRNKEF